MPQRLAGRHAPERGAAVVEFALLLPILLLLVFGIAEFGRAYNLQTTITAAAREGVRVMALQNDPAAARAAARGAATNLALTDAQISVTPSSCASSSTSPNSTAIVTVTFPMNFLTGFFGASITLTGTGVMRCNG